MPIITLRSVELKDKSAPLGIREVSSARMGKIEVSYQISPSLNTEYVTEKNSIGEEMLTV
jgi:hypothetical protein